MDLSNLLKSKGTLRTKKRVGRGGGSGKGFHTTGRGQKGQKSRKGSTIAVGFEGGQVPLYKRIPHIGGFRNPTRKDRTSVTTGILNYLTVKDVSPIELLKKGYIDRVPGNGVKIVAKGELKKELNLKGFLFSKGAKKVIEKSGSKIVE